MHAGGAGYGGERGDVQVVAGRVARVSQRAISLFHADRVFFPKTAAWDSLRRALRATHDDAVWAHLAGDTSAPFAAPVGTDVAVKVIDERGNELPVIRRLGA